MTGEKVPLLTGDIYHDDVGFFPLEDYLPLLAGKEAKKEESNGHEKTEDNFEQGAEHF